MNKHDVLINKEKCVGCGLCVKDCVAGSLSIKNGKAEKINSACIACGHCEAICPENAVELTGFSEESVEFNEQTRLSPDELMAAIKTRRSIRSFKSEPVSDELLNKIIEAGRLAPTGGNSQSTAYIVLDKKLAEAEGIAVKMFRGLINTAKPFVSLLKGMNIDDNFFFKKAPIAIVITGNSVNASLAAQNMAFMAEANGLGVLFSGFFTICANNNPKLRKMLKMQVKEKAVTTLVIGYPAVKYHRTARRNEANVRKL